MGLHNSKWIFTFYLCDCIRAGHGHKLASWVSEPHNTSGFEHCGDSETFDLKFLDQLIGAKAKYHDMYVNPQPFRFF